LQRAGGLLGIQARETFLQVRDAFAQRDRRQPLGAAVERRVDAQPGSGVTVASRNGSAWALARASASIRPCFSIISSTRLRRLIARSGSRYGESPFGLWITAASRADSATPSSRALLPKKTCAASPTPWIAVGPRCPR
jgi:hypothetical protein